MRFLSGTVSACGLDTLMVKTYSENMFRKCVSTLFVALWFILLGIEFSEDMGLFDYDEPGLDQSMEVTLASLGEAIKISDDSNATIPSTLAVQSAPVYLSLLGNFWLPAVQEEKRHFKEDFKIHKLHRIFLI